MVLKGPLLLVSSIFPASSVPWDLTPSITRGRKLLVSSPACSLLLLAGPLVIVLHPEGSAPGMSTPAFDPQSRKYYLKEDSSDHLTSGSGMEAQQPPSHGYVNEATALSPVSHASLSRRLRRRLTREVELLYTQHLHELVYVYMCECMQPHM